MYKYNILIIYIYNIWIYNNTFMYNVFIHYNNIIT